VADRETLLAKSLVGTPWQNWRSEPVGADASFRNYFRLTGPTDQTVILVDAPPEHENYHHFLNVAKTLSDAGLSAPKPLLENHDTGIFVITDLGSETLAVVKNEETIEAQGFEQIIVEVLLKLRRIKFQSGPKLNKTSATEMLDPLFDYYGASGRDQICNVLAGVFEKHVAPELSFSLRDFHAENIVWRKELSGTNKAGLLDFQDAFLAPDGYDLASYTRDVRRKMKPEEQVYMEDEFAKRLGIEIRAFRLQVATLAIQRNLRILGVFAKLIANGKPRYASFLPITWTHITNDLRHRQLSDLENAIRSYVPNPSTKTWNML